MALKAKNKKTNIKALVLFSAVICIVLGCLLLSVNAIKSSFYKDITIEANTSAEPEINIEEEEKKYLESLDEPHRMYGDLADVTIKLTIGDSVEYLDINTFSKWVNATRTGHEVSYKADSEKIREYTHSLSKKYNNYEAYKDFTTHYGEEISIANNSTGWLFDEEYSAKMLEEYILNCQSVEMNLTNRTKESNKWWLRVAGPYDIEKEQGKSYAEVSIDSQYMWVYNNGSVILESPIVTGNPNYGNDTPKGYFFVYNKSSPAILYSSEYETQVSYWIGIIDDVGFHDATWQPYFGGDVYLTNGSHGCVNLPLYFAEELYDKVYVNMPVYVY